MGLPMGPIYAALRLIGGVSNTSIIACADHQTQWYEDDGATAMVVLVIILFVVVAAATITDHLVSRAHAACLVMYMYRSLAPSPRHASITAPGCVLMWM